MKRHRIIINCGPDTLRDATEIAKWFTVDAAPNVSDALRRLIRWAVNNPKTIQPALGCQGHSPLATVSVKTEKTPNQIDRTALRAREKKLGDLAILGKATAAEEQELNEILEILTDDQKTEITNTNPPIVLEPATNSKDTEWGDPPV
jgi:hypothetical protein